MSSDRLLGRNDPERRLKDGKKRGSFWFTVKGIKKF
jgi:hypothetical protein